ncbi:MAG: PAS domain S-box protein [candidate division Zixibacteria bacterium]|nr:PAS domain S-box protein [candidate division Zixibacteria bacterium]
MSTTNPLTLEEGLQRLSSCFLTFSADPTCNIERLTALCGELLGADYALYNRMVDGTLCTWGKWNPPPEYEPSGDPEGHICYDVIRRNDDEILYVPHLQDSSYVRTDPCVKRLSLHTYLGRAVRFGDDCVGSLCAVFKRHFEPGENDRHLFSLLAGAIAVEEERKRALDRVREEGERFQALVEDSTIGMYRTTPDGRVLHANPAIIKMLGYASLEELAERNLETEGYPATTPREVFRRRIAETGRMQGVDSVWLTRSGDPIHVRESAREVRDSDGNLVYYEGTVENITDQTVAEQDLRIKDIAIATSVSAIGFADMQGRVTYVNESFLKMWGYDSTDEVLGRYIAEFAFDPSEVTDHLDQIQSERGWSGEGYIRHKTGARVPVMFSVHSMADQGGAPHCLMATFMDITDRVAAEEELRKNEERYAAVFDGIPVGIVYTDPEGKIEAVNPAFTRITAVAADELIGKNPQEVLRDFVPPKLSTRIRAMIQDAIEGRPVEPLTLTANDKVLELVTPFKEKRRGITWMITDMTDRLAAERAIQESESRFRHLLEELPHIAIQGYSSDGTIHYWNPASESLYGYGAEEALGKDIVELIIPPDMREQVRGAIEEGGRTGTMPGASEVTLMHRDGHLVPVFSSHALVPRRQGEWELYRVDIDLRDIKRTEQALRESEAKYRSLQSNLPVGVFRSTPDGRIMSANAAMVAMYGYKTEAEYLQVPAPEMYADTGRRDELIRILTEKGMVSNFESRCRKRDGSLFWVSVSANAVRDDEGAFVCIDGVERDITERKVAEVTQAVLHLIARATNTTLSLGDMIQSIHHGLSDLIGAKGFFAAFEDAETRELTYPYASCGEQNIRDSFYAQLVADVLTTGRPVVRQPEGLSDDGKPFDVWMAVPLTSTAGTYGAIASTASTEYRPYTEEDFQILPLVAEHISVAVDRRRAEEALKVSEHQFRDLVERAGIGIIVGRRDDQPWFTNDRLAELFGRRPHEMGQQSLESLVHADDRVRVTENLKRLNAGEVSDLQMEFRGVRRDGSTVYIEAALTRLAEENDEVGFRAYLWDVTQRRLAEQALKESEERYRKVVENAWEGICVARGEKLTYANPKLAQITGHSVEELTSGSWTRFIHPLDREMVASIGAQRLKGKDSPTSYEFRIIDPQGTFRWVQNSAVVIDWDGEPATLSFLGDITERKAAEQALRESEATARALLNAPTDSVYLLDDGLHIVDLNETAAAGLGGTMEEFVGRDIRDLFPADLLDSRVAAAVDVLDTGKPVRFEDGREGLWYDHVFYPIVDSEGRVTTVAAIARDITHRRQVEEALTEKNLALREVLRQIENEKQEVHKAIQSNLERTIMPVIRMMQSRMGKEESLLLQQLQNNLSDIVSPFIRNLEREYTRLTPRELEVCSLIRSGMTSKEIAGALNLSIETINKFRHLIRKKLNITNANVNLGSFLRLRGKTDSGLSGGLPGQNGVFRDQDRE